MITARRLRGLGSVLALAWPTGAFAEHISTYWRLEPVEAAPPTTAVLSKPFLSERLVPIGLVALTEPVTVGDEAFPAETLLFKVFNDAGKTGYCPMRHGPPAFVPIISQHPCFVDSDKDGRFDQTFSAFQQYAGLPNLRGSIDGARPLGTTVGYRKADVHDFVDDLRLSLVLRGSPSLKKVHVVVKFSRYLNATYNRPIFPKFVDETANFQVLNTLVTVTSIEGDTAQLQVRSDNNLVVTTDMSGDILARPLPPAGRAD